MPTALELKRIRDLITETVTVLCQSSLDFKSKFTVEGLLGITIDDKDVFLINIHEVVSTAKGKRRDAVKEKSVSCSTVPLDNNENNSLSESHVVVDCMQSPKMKSVKKSSLWQTGCSESCSAGTEENTLPCEQQIAHSFKHEADYSGMPLSADADPLETSLSLSLGGASIIRANTSAEVCGMQDHMNTSVAEDDALDCRFDYVSQDLAMECNSNWSDKQDTNIQV